MNIFILLYKSIFTPLDVINRDMTRGKLKASAAAVLLAALSGSAIGPALYYYTFRDRYDLSLNAGSILSMLSAGIGSWLVVCVLFWLLSKTFNKSVRFAQVASTWGFSYIPNFLCITAYYLLLLKPGLYSGSGLAAFIASAFFIMLLVWKAIYYFMFMKFVVETTLRELLIITAISGAVFFFLMTAGSAVGIQVPML